MSIGRKKIGVRRRGRPREDEFDKLEKEWGKKKREYKRYLGNWYGRSVETFNAYGEPLDVCGGRLDVLDEGDRQKNDIIGKDLKLGLTHALHATGDPLFEDAIAALEAYGLAGGKPRDSHQATRCACLGDLTRGYLENMEWLVDQREYSVKRAAQHVAAFYFVNGRSFETVVKDLETRYSDWKKAGFQEEEINDLGDVGYQVLVRPRDNCRIPFPGRRELAPASGALVPFTAYWRRRFREGSIEMSRATTGD